jgi:hypothetical protein
MTVRYATPDDEEKIMALCRELHNENALLPMCEEKVRATLRIALHRNGGIVGVIGKPKGEIEGAILLVLDQIWYSSEWCVEELFSYVPERFRRSRHAHDLIDFSKQWTDSFAETLGRPVPLLIGILSNVRTEAKVRLYRRKLGEPAGAYFLYGGKTGDANVRV